MSFKLSKVAGKVSGEELPGRCCPKLFFSVASLKGGGVEFALKLPRLVLAHIFISHSDMNELKVFVDLASISAGENDMDVGRVACFHDAVHGYSSLLYDLKQDSGFQDFMYCLKKLWRALDSDESLPEKLVSSVGAGPLCIPLSFCSQEWLEDWLHRTTALV